MIQFMTAVMFLEPMISIVIIISVPVLMMNHQPFILKMAPFLLMQTGRAAIRHIFVQHRHLIM